VAHPAADNVFTWHNRCARVERHRDAVRKGGRPISLVPGDAARGAYARVRKRLKKKIKSRR
jgi:hypothetical protein